MIVLFVVDSVQEVSARVRSVSTQCCKRARTWATPQPRCTQRARHSSNEHHTQMVVISSSEARNMHSGLSRVFASLTGRHERTRPLLSDYELAELTGVLNMMSVLQTLVRSLAIACRKRVGHQALGRTRLRAISYADTPIAALHFALEVTQLQTKKLLREKRL